MIIHCPHITSDYLLGCHSHNALSSFYVA